MSKASLFNSYSLSSFKYLTYLFLCTVAFFIISHLFPLYFETGSESHFKIICSGIFNGSPQGIFTTFGAHIFISDAMAFLYSQMPGYQWFDIFICIAHGILLCHLLLLFNTLNINENSSKYSWLISVSLFLSLNFISLDPTRVSILLTASSMMFLMNFRLTPIMKSWMFLMFILGILIRSESGVLTLALVTFFELYIKGFGQQMVKKLSVFVVVLMPILFAINYPADEEEASYLKIRPYQFALWDFYSEFPDIKLKSKSDSVIFYAATQSFMADESKINEAFFKRVALKKTDKYPSDMLNYFQNIGIQLQKAKEYLTNFLWDIKIFWLLIFLIGLSISGVSKEYWHGWIFLISCSMVLFAIGVLMKMEIRLFYPVMSLWLLASIFYTQVKYKEIRLNLPKIMLTLLLLLSIYHFLSTNSVYYREKQAQRNEIKAVRNQVVNLSATSYVFLDLHSTINWYSYLFQKVSAYDSKIIPLDNGLIYLTNSHQRYLKETFGTQKFPDYLLKAVAGGDSYLMASVYRKDIIETYMQTVYGIKLGFKEIDQKGNGQPVGGVPIFLYRISLPDKD